MAKYPKMINRFFWQENDDGSGVVLDKQKGINYSFDRALFQFSRNLDGRHDPYSLMPELDEEDMRLMLAMLEDSGLLCRRTLWGHREVST